MSKLRAYCELVRLPNVFTAVADVMAGYWLISAEWRWTPQLGLLMVASAALYSAGIVFNDIADREVDRAERPNRPLPSGQISVQQAWLIGLALSVLGLVATFSVGMIAPSDNETGPALILVALLSAILSYDFLLKATPLGPLNMGLCRALNLTLGMSLGWWFTWDIPASAIVALFVYVAAFSFFGQREAGESRRWQLVPAGVGIVLSILVLGFVASWRMAEDTFTLVLWLALLIHISRVTLRAIRHRTPAAVQYAMKTYILCIIAFDAVIASAGQGWPAGAAVLGLLVPALLIGRWVYST